MKTVPSLCALFASLVAGCGPTRGTDSGSDGTAGGDTTGANGATQSGPGSDPSNPTNDCWDDPPHIEADFEIARSLIEEWLDDAGEIPLDQCWHACFAAGISWETWSQVSSCTVSYDADGIPSPESTSGSHDRTDTGSTGADARSSTGSTGSDADENVRLHCEGVGSCGIGRGHEALRPAPIEANSDPVGQWAAAAAHAEAASVASFWALRNELVAHGAPAELVARAVEAAGDELVHARMMTRIAVGRGATPMRPSFGPIRIRALETLAIENAVEGCVRETWSALEATHQARLATDPEIRAAMRRIAADETRHAELAHDIDAWLQTRLSSKAAARTRRARDRAVGQLVNDLERRRAGSALELRAGLPSAHAALHLAKGLRETLWS